MAKRFQGGMGGAGMMKQVAKMQQDMMKLQEELESRTYTGSAGGGAVTAVVSGKKRLLSLDIKPEVVDPEDCEMLGDMVMAAANSALEQAEETMSREMGKFTGGLNLPF